MYSIHFYCIFPHPTPSFSHHLINQCADYDFIKKWNTGVEKGCRVEGYVAVTKVQGHMYIVPSRINDLIPPERLSEVSSRINVTHTINQFSFGDDIPVRV